MPFVERISSPLSEAWTSWVLFGLLVMVCWAIQRQPALLRIAWQGAFARTGRNYSDAAVDALASVLVQIFRIGTLALTLDVVFFTGGTFSFSNYLLTLLLLIGVEALKFFVAWLVNFTFHLKASFGLVYMQYTYLWMLVCLGLLVIDAIRITLGAEMVTTVLLVLSGLFLLVALVIKGIHMCMTHLVSVAYILLYVVTTELLPMVVSALVVKHWIM